MREHLQSEVATASADPRGRRESMPGGGRRETSARLSRPHQGAENLGSRARSPRGGYTAARYPQMRAPQVHRATGGLVDITNHGQDRRSGVTKQKPVLPASSVARPVCQPPPRPVEAGLLSQPNSHQPLPQHAPRLGGQASIPVPSMLTQVKDTELNQESDEICSGSLPSSASRRTPDFRSWCDPENLQTVHEYAPEIFQLLLKEEPKFLPRCDYMDLQKDINAKMRAILMDWLVEVHMKYRLRDETLHLTVTTIDRYLTRMPVLRKRLQLVGVVAMFIAAKFEEINPPGVGDYEYITDNAYTKEDILVMECQMLTTLNFQIVIPTVAHFMDPLQRMNGCDEAHKEFVNYVCELALLEIRMIRYTPSHLVSAAILLSNELLGRMIPWPAILQDSTQHTEEDLRQCVQELRDLLEQAPAHWLQAVRKKYQSQPHHHVARRWPVA